MTHPLDLNALARRLQTYAKAHAAGAFAMPTAAELETLALHTSSEFIVAFKRLKTPSRRRDFVGRTVELPKGSLVAVAVCVEEGASGPSFDAYDVVTAYLDDNHLSTLLRNQGRELMAVQISAASEMIGLWGRPGSGHRYDPIDVSTVSRIPMELPTAVRDEADGLGGWHDDYPFYSDGTWGALSLRGFDDDPAWGVKPREMGKAWNAKHPGNWDRECRWTSLARHMPATVDFIESIDWWGDLERVRFMRMAAKPGGGKLLRHTDITDKSAGTRDGQITRFHLPLATHPDVVMTTWGLDGQPRPVHLALGSAWYLDQRKPHAVVNGSTVDRVHLVVDVLASPEVREMIVRHTQ